MPYLRCYSCEEEAGRESEFHTTDPPLMHIPTPLLPRTVFGLTASKVLTASIASMLALVEFQPEAKAADGTWVLNNNPTAPATNNWSEAANWFNGTVADGADGTAFFV